MFSRNSTHARVNSNIYHNNVKEIRNVAVIGSTWCAAVAAVFVVVIFVVVIFVVTVFVAVVVAVAAVAAVLRWKPTKAVQFII